MKKIFIILTIILNALVFSGCLLYKVNVNGYSNFNMKAQLTNESSIFVLENKDVSNPILDKEIKDKIIYLLKQKGYMISDYKNAEFYIDYDYGIGSGRSIVRTFKKTEKDSEGREYKVYKTDSDIVYDRWLTIRLFDGESYRSNKELKVYWVGEAKSAGSSSDLRNVINYMLVPIFEIFGKDTERAVKNIFVRGDKRVQNLKESR